MAARVAGALVSPAKRMRYDHYMSLRSAGLGVALSLMVLGCATNPSESAGEARMWSAQLARQQQAAREAGRIGYIGNAGPACR